MKLSDHGEKLRVEFDAKHCALSDAEADLFRRDLATLERCIRDFPVADLSITIVRHPRSQDYHVKTALTLSGKTLFTGDRDVLAHPAYERCVRKLVRKVKAYKSQMSRDAEVAKAGEGTRFNIEPTNVPDMEAIRAAVREGDYAAFRRACDVYSEPVRKSVGRWIQRYPALQAEIDERIAIADVVEEVFLNAFERFDDKPDTVLMGDWLEQLIDPSLSDLVTQGEDEFDNVSFVQSWLEAAPSS